MKTHKLFINFLLLLFLVACGGSEQQTTNESPLSDEQNRQAKKVIKSTDQLLLDVRERRVFTTNTRQEQQTIVESMTIIKNSLVKIIAGNDALGAFKTMYTYAKKLEKVGLVQTDSALVSEYKENLYSLVAKIGKQLNVELDDFSWILYETRFSSLWPFTTFSTAGDWVNDWSLGASYAKVRGYGNKSWLLSPLMDLSNVDKAALKLHHMVMVDADSRSKIPFDRNKILETTFKAMVSTDYISGHPSEATWEEVKLTGFPASVNFHATWSDEIDLSKFKGENTTVAILYEMNDKLVGRHYVTWQINKFQLLGISDSFSYKERPVKTYLYQDEFTKRKLGRNKSVATGTADIHWVDFGRGGETEFAKLEASAPGVNTWLMTPKLHLKGKNPVLKLKEVARNLDRDNFLVKISTDYNGGDPSESTWKEFKHIPSDYSAEAGAWKNFNSLDIDLSEFVGKSIVIGFQYRNLKGNHTAWEIDEILIDGEGEKLKTQELIITYENENTVRDIEGVQETFVHSFANGLGEFLVEKSTSTAADFKETSRQDRTYIEISGFKSKSEGITHLISPEIKLSEKTNYLKLTQAINHYKPEAIKLKLIDTIIVADGKKVSVEFLRKPLGASWDTVESEWLELPNEFRGKSIKVILKYEGLKEKNLYPSWNIFELKLGEK